ncbi:MAG: hypothetical protein WC873_02405 [Candidatus Gracilibacteria bacterium]
MTPEPNQPEKQPALFFANPNQDFPGVDFDGAMQVFDNAVSREEEDSLDRPDEHPASSANLNLVMEEIRKGMIATGIDPKTAEQVIQTRFLKFLNIHLPKALDPERRANLEAIKKQKPDIGELRFMSQSELDDGITFEEIVKLMLEYENLLATLDKGLIATDSVGTSKESVDKLRAIIINTITKSGHYTHQEAESFLKLEKLVQETRAELMGETA